MRLHSSYLAILFGLILPLHGQTSANSRDFTIVSEVKLVLLDVAVRDAGGEFVSGLTRDNFQVFDNGKEQPLSVFSGEDTPVTVGILIDRSGSMSAKRREVANAAMALIGAGNPNDEVFVVSFGDRVTFDLPSGVLFTGDHNLLLAALKKERPQGRTSLYDAITAALGRLADGTRARKTLVVISDGGDSASQCKAGDALSMARSAGATIHAVGIYDPDANEHTRDLGFLRRLTGITGGQLVTEHPATNLISACRRIAADIRSRYTMGFHPPDAVGPQVRKIRVNVSAAERGKLTARTRESYVIPGPEKVSP